MINARRKPKVTDGPVARRFFVGSAEGKMEKAATTANRIGFAVKIDSGVQGALPAAGRRGSIRMMKSRDGVVRLKRFHVEERRRQVAQIEMMIADFERIAKELDDQIVTEQDRSGIHDTSHFAYPTFAKAAAQRRDNLMASANELKEQLATAQEECAEAEAELEKIQAIVERDMAHDRAARGAVHTASGGR